MQRNRKQDLNGIYKDYINSAIDSEKKDRMVDSAIEAEARFVSLLSCEDSMYRAGEVGSVK